MHKQRQRMHFWMACDLMKPAKLFQWELNSWVFEILIFVTKTCVFFKFGLNQVSPCIRITHRARKALRVIFVQKFFESPPAGFAAICLAVCPLKCCSSSGEASPSLQAICLSWLGAKPFPGLSPRQGRWNLECFNFRVTTSKFEAETPTLTPVVLREKKWLVEPL